MGQVFVRASWRARAHTRTSAGARIRRKYKAKGSLKVRALTISRNTFPGAYPQGSTYRKTLERRLATASKFYHKK